MLEEQDFHHTVLSEGRATAQQQQNLSYNHTIILSARIAENANLSDIFPFEFEANESPFLLSNAATNEQKAITAMYTETEVPAICGIFNKCSEKAPAFEFEPEEKKPIIETFMAFGSTFNWADETEQEHFIPHTKPKTSGWNILYSKPEPRKQYPYIPLKDMLLEECNWIDIAMRGGVCDQTCQYVLSISEKVKRGTLFNAAYNSALNKLYHYPHDAEIIFNLAMALINRATKEDVRQMKEAEYIEYTMELAGFDYEDEVEVYHQIASHTYPTQEAQI
ncbi:hypothetical protein G9A89_019964 [Geosiphon pyriformis]|nr:hypothetical protein G9A89_019964 [Geosiphon pyriformis]